MSNKPKHIHDDDDGRTIVDMSGIDRPSLFLPRMPGAGQGGGPRRAAPPEPMPQQPSWVDDSPSKEEMLWAMLGALKAALLIGLTFIVGLGLVILVFLQAAG